MFVRQLRLLTVLSLWPIGATAAAPPFTEPSPSAVGTFKKSTANALVTDASCRYQLLHSFGRPGPGGGPNAKLIQGWDGALYGTAEYGGSNNFGTVFKLNPDGTGYTALAHFDHSTTGGYPLGGLLQGTDGALYGTTSEGGSGGSGTVFKLNPDGSGFVVLNNFVGSVSGDYPYGGLVQGIDGALFGTAVDGGSDGWGTVFKLNPDGSGFVVLKNFVGAASGGYPYGGLVQGADGVLYGTTSDGGSNGQGTIFKLNRDGTGFAVLKNFVGAASGAHSFASLLQGPDGALYGTAAEGGSNDSGTIFKLNPDGSGFTVLKSMDGFTSGSAPLGELIEGTDGALYGTNTYGGIHGSGTVFKLNRDGSAFAVVWAFEVDSTGRNPHAGLIQAADGALYGTTPELGQNGAGVVFKLNPDGSGFHVVFLDFSFDADMSDGGGKPSGGLIQATNGALYGTTAYGGSDGWGTLFRLNPDGTDFTVLRNLDFYTTGSRPDGDLLQGTDGALFGAARSGGTHGVGTVFKINMDGTGFTTLLNFSAVSTGAYPAGLIQGTDGLLYGTASRGGSNDLGTVFRLSRDGTGLTVLEQFSGSTTGAYPNSGVIQGLDGALYGTTYEGGISFSGTVFKLNPDGTGFAVLRQGGSSAGLIQGTDSVLYGTTVAGGSGGGGTVFKLYPNGNGFIVLRNFDFSGTGHNPYAGLVLGSDGALYGSTNGGGSGASGTLFKLNPATSDFTVVWNFDPVTIGAHPGARLIQGTDDLMYGAVVAGGTVGAGGVFRFDPFVDHNPPQARCKNLTITAGANCTASASIDDGSSDPDAGDRITVAQDPAGPYPLGDTLVTLTVTDRGCMSSTCTGTVTVPAGTPCNDGDACTVNDICRLGSGCVGTNSITCVPSDQCHDAGTCAPSTGLCTNPAKADGSECNDGNACTTDDACTDGVCAGGPSRNCDDGNCCTIDACNPATGCYHTAETTSPVFVQQPSLGSCAMLWPPNHGYADFTAAETGAAATSACGIASIQFASCGSSQLENGSGVGDGNSNRDCVYEPGALHLRAERDGACSPIGRVYTMQMVAVDVCGNLATSNPFDVGVWHDRAAPPTVGTILHPANGSNTSDTRNGTDGTYGPGCGSGTPECGEPGQAHDNSDAVPEMEILQSASISVDDLHLDKTTGGSVHLTWTEPTHAAATNVTRYHVYRLDPVTWFWTQLAELTKQSNAYLDLVLNDGNDWKYEVTAVIK